MEQLLNLLLLLLFLHLLTWIHVRTDRVLGAMRPTALSIAKLLLIVCVHLFPVHYFLEFWGNADTSLNSSLLLLFKWSGHGCSEFVLLVDQLEFLVFLQNLLGHWLNQQVRIFILNHRILLILQVRLVIFVFNFNLLVVLISLHVLLISEFTWVNTALLLHCSCYRLSLVKFIKRLVVGVFFVIYTLSIELLN